MNYSSELKESTFKADATKTQYLKIYPELKILPDNMTEY